MRLFIPFEREERLIARFGAAELVQDGLGRVELRGGEPEDHASAREWVSLFMHEAVPRITRGGGSGRRGRRDGDR